MWTVKDILVPFIQASTAERWLVMDDPEEISLILSDITDFYESRSTIEKLNVEDRALRNVVLLIIENISRFPDQGLRLNGFRLLRSLCQQHSQEFLAIAEKVFLCIKMCFQDISKSVKEAALKFGVQWFSRISFRTSGVFICQSLEGATTFSEPMITLSSVAVLQCIVEIGNHFTDRHGPPSFVSSIDFLANYALGVVVRLQHSVTAALIDDDLWLSAEVDSRKVAHQTARATQMVLLAAMDLLALSCICLYAIEGCTSGRPLEMAHCKSNPSVVVFLHSDSLDLGALSKPMEQELLKRVRTFSFSSLLQESAFEVTMRLLDEIEAAPTSDARRTDRANSRSSAYSDDTSVAVSSESHGEDGPLLRAAAPPLTKHHSRSLDFSTTLVQLPPPSSSSSMLSLSLDEAGLAHSTTTPVLRDPSEVLQLSSPHVAPPLSVRNPSFDRQMLRSLKSPHLRAHSYSGGLIAAMTSPGGETGGGGGGSPVSGKYDVYLEEPRVLGPPKASPLTPSRKSGPSPLRLLGGSPLTDLAREVDDGGGRMASLPPSLSAEAMPSPSVAGNDNYLRAASARVKRSRLKHFPPAPLLPAPHSPAAGGGSGAGVAEEVGEAKSCEGDDADSVSSSIHSRTPMAAKQSLASPNVRHREVRRVTPAAASQPRPLVRQASDGSATSSMFDFDLSSAVYSGGSSVEDGQGSGNGGGGSPHASVQATPLHALAKSEAFDYIPAADLLPLNHPSVEISGMVQDLETQDWPDVFHTLNKVRRAVLHHPALVLQTCNLHRLVQLVLRHVQNLRSSLAKNALLTVADCFLGLKKAMDVEALAVVPVILKRSADSSNFLGESADQALLQMILHLSPSRSLAALLPGVTHKTAAIRAKASCLLAVLLRQHSADFSGSKDVDAVKSYLDRMLQDSSPEARASGREVVRTLFHALHIRRTELEACVRPDLLDKALRDPPGGNVPSSTASNLRGCLSTESTEVTASPVVRPTSHLPRISKYRTTSAQPAHLLSPSVGGLDEGNLVGGGEGAAGRRAVHSAAAVRGGPGNGDKAGAGGLPVASRHPGGGATRSHGAAGLGLSEYNAAATSSLAAKRMMDSDGELIQWADLQMRIATAKGLQDKKEAITAMTGLLARHHGVLRDAGKLEASLDSVLDRLEDGSIKIVVHAMDCLEQLQEQDPRILQYSGPHVISPRLLGAVASSNKAISQRASSLLTRVYGAMSSTQAASYLAHVVEHEKDKLRIAAMKVLLDMLACPQAEEADYLQSVIRRIIFPSVCRAFFSEAVKADLRVACADYFKALQQRLRSLPGAVKLVQWLDSSREQDELRRITNLS